MHIRHDSPNRRRARSTLAILAAAAMLAGCTPKAERTAKLDAMADQMMAVQAYPAAAGTLLRAISIDSNDPDRWVKLGRAQRAMGQESAAATAFQHALDLAPDNIEALQGIGVIYARAGQADMAKNYLNTLMVLAPDDLGGMLALGAIALREHRLIDADKYADKVIKLGPGLSEGFLLKARVMEERGDVAGAATLLTNRMALDENNAVVATQVLRLDRLRGDRAGIRKVALTLARLIPDDPRYQLEASRTHRANGDAAQADAILAQLHKRYVANPQVMLGLAHQWLDIMPPAAAIARIQEATRTAPGASKAALAMLLVRLDKADSALALLKPALGDKVGSDTVDAKSAYAVALLAAGRSGEARAVAEEVLAFDNHNSEGLIVRAKVEAATKDYTHALDDAQLLMSQNPDNAEAPLLVARVWAEKGNGVMADKAFGVAQDRFPDDLLIHRERIGWLVSQGRVKDAASLATSFANAHRRSAEAKQLMVSTCKVARDPICTASAV